jgi:methyl-accepting chemotaxis protein
LTLKNVDELSKAKIEQVASDVADANETLGADVKALGEPPKTAAPEAKDALEELRGKLETSAGQIKSATQDISGPREVLEAVNSTSAALLTISSDISATLATLESVDAADEWKQAFGDAEACKSLGTS